MQAARKGQPLLEVTFRAWDLTPLISDAAFTPNVPADFEGIAMLQRAAAVKAAAAQPAADAPK